MSDNIQLIRKKIEHLQRNAVNHEYEENSERLSDFFQELAQASPTLNLWFDRIVKFCDFTYPAIVKPI